MNRILCLLLLFFTVPAFAQIHLGVEVGTTHSTMDFRIPPPNQNQGFFVQNRVGYNFGVSVEKPVGKWGLYGATSLAWYRAHLGVGPFLNPGGGYEYPSYSYLQIFVGSHTDVGVRRVLWENDNLSWDAGLGLGYMLNISDSNLEYPYGGKGPFIIFQVLRYDIDMTYHTPHMFHASANTRFHWTTKRDRHWWVRAQYNQGLRKSITGQVDYFTLDLDNNETYQFSFPILLRQSFLSVTLGYQLFSLGQDR